MMRHGKNVIMTVEKWNSMHRIISWMINVKKKKYIKSNKVRRDKLDYSTHKEVRMWRV